MKTLPVMGSFTPAPSWALAKAMAKLSSIPMTSPVDFISGPRMVSTPGNLTKGKTDSLTAMCLGSISAVIPSSRRVLPAMTRAAILARGLPVALDTKGAVREARGLTSRM